MTVGVGVVVVDSVDDGFVVVDGVGVARVAAVGGWSPRSKVGILVGAG